jgi:AraC-like DNA-binding protein
MITPAQNSLSVHTVKSDLHGQRHASVGFQSTRRTMNRASGSNSSIQNAKVVHHEDEVISICQDFIHSLESQWAGIVFQVNEFEPALQEVVCRLKKLIAHKTEIVHLIQEPSTIKHGSHDYHFLMNVKQILDTNLADPEFGLNQFAGELCMSKSKLYRKLTELTGYCPNELIRHYRLQRGFSLVSNQTGSIKEIAYQCGFSNLSYFAKCFKEKFGVSPSEIWKSC